MAELIDKGVALKLFDNCGLSMSRTFVKNRISNMPTTTEAEIRASVIDEFAEKLTEAFSEKSSDVNVRGLEINVLTLDRAIEILWYLKQQLKEE